MLGKLLDRRYQVIQVLGAGGFGKTYLAQDTRRPGNPTCVVKHLKPLNSDSSVLETARRLFSSEAETLEQLGNHDQIPRLLAYFEEDQEFYLVQEFIEGHTLTQELPLGQRWEESRVIGLLSEVLNVLEFVHAHGVIHRDVKPDNLIRRRADNKLVLVDFGAVKQIRTQFASTQGSHTITIGTPGYMSSEQALGHPRPSSDLYALGIIGIQALTGVMPVQIPEDLNTGEVLWQQLVSVSPRLAAVLTKLVRYHFKDRYQSATEALQALRLNAYPSTHYSTAPSYPATTGYSAVQEVPTFGQRFPQPAPSPLSEQRTRAVSPAYSPAPRQPVASPPRSRQVPAVQPDRLPLLVGTSLVLTAAVVLGTVYAVRQNAIAPLVSDASRQVVDPGTSCTVTVGVLNVRSEPKGQVINTVKQGMNLALTGTGQDGWVEINAPVQGWVFNEKQYIDCSVARVTPVKAVTPKPSPTPVKPADDSSSRLTAAADKYQSGDLDGAIADAKSVPPGSSAYKDAQAAIERWQQEWSTAQAKFNEVQQALNEGRWTEVLPYATDPDFLKQRYWREKLNQLIEEAKKRQAEPSPEPSASKPTAPLYYVLVNDDGDRALEAARAIIGDAFVRDFPEGTRIQMGAFSIEAEANALVNQLQQQGIAASIYRP